MIAKKVETMYWFFNTDESESVGKGAHQRMIEQSCIAAWGTCIRHGGAKETLEQLGCSDTVFLFRAKHGIVAIADVTDEAPTPSTTVFPDGEHEYKRPVQNLRVAAAALSCAAIRDATGYDLPCRHIVCRIRKDVAVKYILSYFANCTKRNGVAT